KPLVEVVSILKTVERRPLILDALHRAEYFGAAKAVELALRQAKPILPCEEFRDVLLAHPVGDNDGHQRISRTRPAADDLLGARAVEIRHALLEKYLPGRAVDPR